MTRRRVLAIACATLLASVPVAAQPESAIGKPLASADLVTGTIWVRVVDGTFTAPSGNIKVTLVGAGAPREATTDANGRATFDNITAGTTVKVSAATSDPLGSSESFVVPATGGTRIVLSTKPWVGSSAGPPPVVLPRQRSGEPVVDPDMTPGTADVRLTYDDLAGQPPLAMDVALVGYAADDSVSVVHASSDSSGIAHFTNLEHTGAVAYFALAQLPRHGSSDRLISVPFTLGDSDGVRIVLSGERRTSAAPPVDDAIKLAALTPTTTPKGKVRIQLSGVFDPKTPIEVHDATTGKVVAKGTAAGKELVLGVALRPGQIWYAEAISRGQHYRSLPVALVADRGLQLSIVVMPRLLEQFVYTAAADDDALQVRGEFKVSNYSWIPYTERGQRLRIPLPRGARKIEIAQEDRELIATVASDIEVLHPLPPGDQQFNIELEIPADKGIVEWSLDLPQGTYHSSFYLAKEAGLSLDNLPPGLNAETAEVGGGSYLGISNITILPNQSMELRVHLPRPGPDVAVMHACRKLRPDQTALVGKPLPQLTLAQLDGSKLALSSLKGTPMLINLWATWDMLSRTERPKLAALAKQVRGLAIVLVASDRKPAEVAAEIGPKPPFRVVLDPPAKADDAIGAVTTSWGVVALPESLLVDRKGIVRYHFQNARDWDSPDAIRCIKAIIAGP